MNLNLEFRKINKHVVMVINAVLSKRTYGTLLVLSYFDRINISGFLVALKFNTLQSESLFETQCTMTRTMTKTDNKTRLLH